MDKRVLVVSDVDGCLTDGGMYYDCHGKAMKRFSAGDHEGLKLLIKNGIDVMFITADRVGLGITNARLSDMSKYRATCMSENDRLLFFKNLRKDNPNDLIVFFGDGLADAIIKNRDLCNIFVCPKQARNEVKMSADYICQYDGGHGAFLDMAIWLCGEYLQNKYIDFIYKDLYED